MANKAVCWELVLVRVVCRLLTVPLVAHLVALLELVKRLGVGVGCVVERHRRVVLSWSSSVELTGKIVLFLEINFAPRLVLDWCSLDRKKKQREGSGGDFFGFFFWEWLPSA